MMFQNKIYYLKGDIELYGNPTTNKNAASYKTTKNKEIASYEAILYGDISYGNMRPHQLDGEAYKIKHNMR